MEEFEALVILVLAHTLRRNLLVNMVVTLFWFCIINWTMDTVMWDLLMLHHCVIYALLFCVHMYFSYRIISFLLKSMEGLRILTLTFKWPHMALSIFLFIVFYLWINIVINRGVDFILMLLQMHANFNAANYNVNGTFTERDMRKYKIYVIA